MEQKEIEEYERLVREGDIRAAEGRIYAQAQDSYNIEAEKSIVSQQLDLGEELDRIDYLLRGYTLERDPQTNKTTWQKPQETEMIIFTEYGVHLIRNTIAWYLNKNTLLSNYDDKTIDSKMEDFASDLNDTIFMEYEKIFQYPSFEECKKVLNSRIENKEKIRIYAMELMGRSLSDKDKYEIKQNILREIEPIIERELEKVKQQIIKNKLKRFLLVMRQIQDAVHSTYLRAWKGQERATIRQHTHITETRGGLNYQQPRTNPLDIFKRR